ncbi:MAG: ECF transporter S component [Candidatus Avispirillum sp.]
MNKNKTVTNNKKKISIREIAGCGMLVAVAVVLQYIEISIPIMPSFIKLDFSDLPELIGAFAYGPLFGVIISLLKNLIHMLFSQSGFVGELSNFILGAVFSFTAGIIYKYNKEKKFALISGVCGAVAMAVVSVPVNYFIIYPMYYGILNFPEEAVLGMYQVILPGIKSIFQALLVFNLPFTLVKGLICVAISMFIYKPLTKILKEKS